VHTLLPVETHPELVRKLYVGFFFLVHPMHGPMHGKGLSLFQAKKNLHPTGDEYAHDHALAERGFSYDKGIVYVLMERREAFYTLPFTLWPPESSF